MRIRDWGLGIWLLISACAQSAGMPTPALEPVRVAVTDLAAPLAADLVAAYRQTGNAPVVSVIPLASLADELQAGSADFAITANPTPEQFATPIASVSFAVIVHPDNPIARLSLAQVRALLAGQITDWAQVGGETNAIRVVVREEGSEAALAFYRVAGIELALARNALLAPTWAAMRELVAETPGAFGYMPRPELGKGMKTVPLDVELQALLVAVALSEPAGSAREFLAWVQSDEGQRVVSQHYIPIR